MKLSDGIRAEWSAKDGGSDTSRLRPLVEQAERLEAEIDTLRAYAPAAPEPDWQDDPSADDRWNAGLDYGMVQLCAVLGVNPHMVTWDAATETLDGDVCAAIGNVFREKYGDDFDPTAPTVCPNIMSADSAQAAFSEINLIALGGWSNRYDQDFGTKDDEYKFDCIREQANQGLAALAAAPHSAATSEPPPPENGMNDGPRLALWCAQNPDAAAAEIERLRAAPTTSPEPDAVREALAPSIRNHFDSALHWRVGENGKGLDNGLTFIETRDLLTVRLLRGIEQYVATLSRPAHGGWPTREQIADVVDQTVEITASVGSFEINGGTVADAVLALFVPRNDRDTGGPR